MASVWQRKRRKGWVLDFRKDGRRVRVLVNVDTEHEAHLKLDEYLKGATPLPQDTQDAAITLSGYAEKWFKRMEGQLEAKTLLSYKQLFDLHIKPVLGACVVRELRRKRIKELLDKKRQDGKGKNTLRLIRATLSTMLSDAVDDEILSVNPAFSLFRKKRGANLTPPDVNPMTWEQVLLFEQALAQMLQEGRVQFRDAVLFQVLRKAGLRPSEAMALHPGDVDLHRKKLRVERAMGLNGEVKATKTAEARTVDLSPGLVATLDHYLSTLQIEAMAAGKDEADWLFPGDQGGAVEERNTRKIFRRILTTAKLPKFRVYDLRHTFASLLLSDGVPLLYVSQQLGHSKPTTTLKYYAKWVAKGDRSYVDRLDLAPTWHQTATASEGGSQVPDFGGPCRGRTCGPLIKSERKGVAQVFDDMGDPLAVPVVSSMGLSSRFA